jgi:branched-subunit amino acid aminotransferase/4-amino-4-deoxychorismate lyase
MSGGIAFLDAHLDRLYEGAKAISMEIGLSRDALARRLFACLAANNMHDGVHIRLMVTRGVKRTPYQDPRVTIGPATIVIIPGIQDAQARGRRERHLAVHRPCAPHRAGRAGPEAQLALQAETAFSLAFRRRKPAPTKP